ncbi:MAG: hypothetical protein IH983_05340 [Planctomycetes bacterium]|nr:hypothetical protein [Planctomycetota bacterium]
MKRRLVTLAIFLLLGAVVNVAVAWGITAHAEFNETSLRQTQETIEDSEWPRVVPQHWPPVRTAWDAHAFGWRVRRFMGRRLDEDRTTGQLEVSEHFLVDIYEVGWPSGSLQWETWLDFTISRNPQVTTSYRFKGQPARTWWRSGIPVSDQRFGFGSRSWKGLPIRPVYFGFAINTLFYAGILWLVIAGRFALRRHIRRKRGLCVACGYDLRHADHAACPECGGLLPQP